MKSIRKRVKEQIMFFLNRQKREQFFKYIISKHPYVIKETKHSYELLFADNSKSILPKSLFSFIKRWQKSDHPFLDIGRNTYLQNLKLDILFSQNIKIGSYCSFGPNVVIKPDGIRGKAQFTTYPLDLIDAQSLVYHKIIDQVRENFVHIGNDCFIGEDSKIMANVTVGDGVIIGERSLVTNGKTLEPFGIYAGVPAKLIGYRYSREIIDELMRIKWWEWSFDKIQKSGLQNIDFIENPDEALKCLREYK
ncbi:MAG: CatB-related O-acetyltransferase [Campylobacterales bacterium]|nr:CatB-related O-acetyltransferase [Campylobacterales bacterium]